MHFKPNEGEEVVNPKRSLKNERLLKFSSELEKLSFKAKTVSGPAVYHMGIVDFLQDWSFRKKVERMFKIYIGRKDPDGLSVMHPEPYKIRFQKKLDQIFDMDNVVKKDNSLKLIELKESVSHSQKSNKNIVLTSNNNEILNPLITEDNVLQSTSTTTISNNYNNNENHKEDDEVNNIELENLIVTEDYVSIDHFDDEDL